MAEMLRSQSRRPHRSRTLAFKLRVCTRSLAVMALKIERVQVLGCQLYKVRNHKKVLNNMTTAIAVRSVFLFCLGLFSRSRWFHFLYFRSIWDYLSHTRTWNFSLKSWMSEKQVFIQICKQQILGSLCLVNFFLCHFRRESIMNGHFQMDHVLRTSIQLVLQMPSPPIDEWPRKKMKWEITAVCVRVDR